MGTAPTTNSAPLNQQQRLASLQQPQQSYSTGLVRPVHTPVNNNAELNSRIVPPRYQSDTVSAQYQQQQHQQQKQHQQVGMNRSTSDTTVMQRGSSMNNTPVAEHFNYNYPGSIPTSNNNSPLPSKGNVDSDVAPVLTKRDSSSLLQQQGYVKPGAPPRHDSLRKPSHQVQSTGENFQVSEEQTHHASSMPLASNEQQKSSLPPQIITSDLAQKDQPQKHPQYYNAGLHHDYVLPSVTENNLDSLLDYYSPVDTEPPSLKSKTLPK
jgi:hypothetical protein